jgi:hypothetical protein
VATKDHVSPQENPAKERQDWVTGDEPMTGPRSYLDTLARESGEPVEDELTKAEASEKIEELQEKTGRGRKTTPRKRAAPKRKSK